MGYLVDIFVVRCELLSSRNLKGFIALGWGDAMRADGGKYSEEVQVVADRWWTNTQTDKLMCRQTELQAF